MKKTSMILNMFYFILFQLVNMVTIYIVAQ
jgi:hypothetical protein